MALNLTTPELGPLPDSWSRLTRVFAQARIRPTPTVGGPEDGSNALRRVRDENKKLKQLVADLSLDKTILRVFGNRIRLPSLAAQCVFPFPLPAGRGGTAGGLLARFAFADRFRERGDDDRPVDGSSRARVPTRVRQRPRSTRAALNPRRFAALLSVGCALGLFACWRAPLRGIDFGPTHDPFRNEGYVDVDEIKSEPIYRLVLVGDGGEPGRDDPTLALLGKWGDAHPARTAVVFLGDNLYPAGLPFQGNGRARGEAILLQQIRATRARELFIPGNHDWGWSALRRGPRGVLINEQKFIESHGAGFDPKNGCPGPVAVELLPSSNALAGGLTVIALDLDWWLLPEPARPVCEGIASTDDFIARLRDELHKRRAENVVVVAHHPIRSGGPHGGLTRGFWTDLGVSLYYRAYSVQDLIEPHYEEMVKVLGKVLAEDPPLAMVGGHDHSLQILDGGNEARLVVVSGAASNVTGVTSIEGTLFAHAHKGFVVFDFHRANETADGVLLVNVVETGRGERPIFSLALDLAREKATPQPVPPKKVPAP